MKLATPGERLRWARKRAKYDDATSAANAFGWTVSTYLGHENGDRNPSRKKAMQYADAFRVRWEWILEGEGQPTEPPGAARRVPVLSWVSAGRISAAEPVTKAEVLREVAVADLPAGDWAALEVSGDSMDRIAPDGATIIVNRSDQRLLPERFYVVANEAGEATFKRFRTPNKLQPFSTNPDHETLLLPEPAKVFGRVRRVITNLD